MKSLLLAVFLCSLIIFIKAAMEDDCAKELGYKKENIPEDKNDCLLACLEVKIGFLKPDYSIDVEGQTEHFKNMAERSKGKIQFEQVKEIANICKNVAKGKSLCEVTPILLECFETEQKKRGISL